MVDVDRNFDYTVLYVYEFYFIVIYHDYYVTLYRRLREEYDDRSPTRVQFALLSGFIISIVEGIVGRLGWKIRFSAWSGRRYFHAGHTLSPAFTLRNLIYMLIYVSNAVPRSRK